MIDLTAFQQHCILVIAVNERQHDEVPHGLAVKSGLERLYGEDVNHGRLYPNLDELVDEGLIKKSERDRRTNEYGLTEAGARAIDDLESLVCFAQGDDVKNPYVSRPVHEQAPADD